MRRRRGLCLPRRSRLESLTPLFAALLARAAAAAAASPAAPIPQRPPCVVSGAAFVPFFEDPSFSTVFHGQVIPQRDEDALLDALDRNCGLIFLHHAATTWIRVKAKRQSLLPRIAFSTSKTWTDCGAGLASSKEAVVRVTWSDVGKIAAVLPYCADHQTCFTKRRPELADKIFFARHIVQGLGAIHALAARTRDSYNTDECRLVFAGGTKSRDFGSVLSACEALGLTLTIATCASDAATKRCEKSPNCQLHKCINQADFIALASRACVVTVPLSKTHLGFGLTSFLQLQGLGKPTVVTKSATWKRYCEDGTDCVMVPKGDGAAWQNALHAIVGDRRRRIQLAGQSLIASAATSPGHTAERFNAVNTMLATPS